MFRYVIFVISLLCIFVGTAQADNYYVDGTKSGGGNDWANAFGNLQQALSAAASGDTIYIAEGTYKPSLPVQDPTFEVPNGVTVMGGYASGGSTRDILTHKTILSGDMLGNDDYWYRNKSDNISTVLSVVAGSETVVLDGLVIEGGHNSSGDGGGLYAFNVDLIIYNCYFHDNYAAFGGAVSAHSGTLEIYNTIDPFSLTSQGSAENNFYGNRAEYAGGAISSGTLIINGLRFENNWSGGKGGAIENAIWEATVTNCKFKYCSASNCGGAISSEYNNRATYSGCLFEMNSCGDTGGAVYSTNSGYGTKFDRCRFESNTANYGDNPEPRGAGVYCENDIVSFTNCEFKYGYTLIGSGIYFESGDCTITNCTFECNTAIAYCGAGLFANSPATVTNCIFWDNVGFDGTSDYDDQIYAPSGITVTYSCIQDSETVSNPNPVPDYNNNIINYYPWNPYLETKPLVDLGNNNAVNTPYDLVGSKRIFGGTVDMGAYEDKSSAVRFVDINSTNTVKDGKSWATAVAYVRDALNMASADEKIEEIWIADGTYYPDNYEPGVTAGTNVREESFVILDGIKIYGGFQGSTSTEYPSGEFSINDRKEDIILYPTILSGDIDQAPGNYGNSYNVVTASGTSSSTLLDRVVIRDGNASGRYANSDGGGMIINNGNLKVVDCSFLNNTAINRGGAVYNNFSSPTFENCKFEGNTALFGGAVFNYYKSNPQIEDCDLINNTAENGGAIMNHTESNPIIISCAIVDNSAVNNIESFIDDYGYGGGILNTQSSSPEIINCAISNNQTNGFGGGMFDHYNCNTQVINCTITYNTTNTVIPSGCGIMHSPTANDPSKTTIYNSIIWNNSNGTTPTFDMQYYPGWYFISEYNCVTGIAMPNDDHNINSDPKFIDGSNDPTVERKHTDGLYLKLNPLSPCIDTGFNDYVPNWLYDDIAGYKRIQAVNYDVVDRGAYEVGSEPGVEQVIVVLSWIDETQGNYIASPQTYDQHLSSYSNLIANQEYRVLSKCFDLPASGYVDQVIPYGYSEPDEIDIEYFPRNPNLELQDFIDGFNSLVGDAKPVYILLTVDNSGSMTEQGALNPYDNQFRTWLSQNYPEAFINPDGDDDGDGYDDDHMYPVQEWIKSMENLIRKYVLDETIQMGAPMMMQEE